MERWLDQLRDFISKDERQYRHKVGNLMASALSGFIAGVAFASIVWILGFIYYQATR